MTSDLEVDTEAVRSCAATLSGTAADVRAGVTPPPTVAVPRWQTSDAAEALADAMERAVAGLAGDLEALRRAVLAAVTDYEAADARAASRFGGVR